MIKRSKHHSASTKELNQQSEQDANKQEKAKDDSEINKHTTKASRHLFLIRHGQYNMATTNPDEMKLTELGNGRHVSIAQDTDSS